MASKERAVVLFPGRGSYAAKELGYLARHHADRADTVKSLDTRRGANGAPDVAGLDALAKFSPSKHLPGRNASNLIYTSALLDYAAIDRDRFEVVAIGGNSLGWYLSLAAAGALSLEDGAHLVDTMGNLMETEGVGGQLLVPVATEDWQVDAAKRAQVMDAVAATPDAFLSIDLAGTLVLAGSDAAVRSLQSGLGDILGEPPVQLPKHAAFHTPLLSDIAAKARTVLSRDLFSVPDVALIDGRGAVWSPDASDVDALFDYTLDTQIVAPYDFAKSVEVAVKEFCPDRLILAGPGSSLGAPIAQALVAHRWQGMADRADFMARQEADPFLVAMGRDEQRALATG